MVLKLLLGVMIVVAAVLAAAATKSATFHLEKVGNDPGAAGENIWKRPFKVRNTHAFTLTPGGDETQVRLRRVQIFT
jgi:hypothetical protein